MDYNGSDLTIIYSPDDPPSRQPDLRLLHYNDVYRVSPNPGAEPVGGLARFMTLVKYYRDDPRFDGQSKLITLFSGDAFNPSLESSITKGAHMVSVLNDIGTDVACMGNHDLDFGVRQFRNLASKCKFPWLLANVLDPALGKDIPLANVGRTTMLTASNGLKIGVVGLGEREWLGTINSLPPDLEYRSATETAKQLVPGLKSAGADMIIALTHQREPNDNKLGQNCGRQYLDLILSGHDHFYSATVQNGVHVLRSGTDFKQLSYIECWKPESADAGWAYRITRRDLNSNISEDTDTLVIVDHLTRELNARLDKPVGYTLVPLDARFTTVRTRESNIGNFVCDLMRFYYHAEACIMAAGTIRGDQIYAPGVLKMKDIMNCFPFEDPVIVIECTGQAILDALENSVCLYPALEGRFPQVSNIKFTFDPRRAPHARIVPDSVKVAGAPLDLTRKYTLATRGYMGRGKDGFSSLLVKSEGGEAEEIVNEESGVLISAILRQYFMSLKVLGRWKNWGNNMQRHWSSVNEKLHCASPVIESHESRSIAEATYGADARKPGSTSTPLAQVRNAQFFEQDSKDDGLASEFESDSEDTIRIPSAHSRKSIAGELLWTHEDDIRMRLVRRVVKRWRRLAGLTGDAAACDAIPEADFHVRWTKAIAPRLENRITMVTEG